MKNLIKIFSIILFILLFINGCNAPQNKNKSKLDQDTISIVKSNIPTIEEIINYMCSNEIVDREKGTLGNKKVTEYLNNVFKELELEYVFNSSYLNTFEYEESSNVFLNANNVVGKIKGKDSTKTIILTAHFDAWYNGALDNASGVASLIQIANNLKTYTKENELDYDIIFCLTNLEMNRYIGSKAFIKDIQTQQYKDIVNINIDCIGAKNAGPMSIKNLSRIKESSNLYFELKNIYDEMNIEYIDDFSTNKTKQAFKRKDGVSDYIAFEQKDIPNMQVAQYGIAEFILNENDKPNILDFNKINEISNALTELIKRYNF